MKKVLVALTLAAAGVASAQVGIYGRVGTYLDNTKTGTATVQGMANDLSHFGIRATEKLDGGLTARVTYETGQQSRLWYRHQTWRSSKHRGYYSQDWQH